MVATRRGRRRAGEPGTTSRKRIDTRDASSVRRRAHRRTWCARRARQTSTSARSFAKQNEKKNRASRLRRHKRTWPAHATSMRPVAVAKRHQPRACGAGAASPTRIAAFAIDEAVPEHVGRHRVVASWRAPTGDRATRVKRWRPARRRVPRRPVAGAPATQVALLMLASRKKFVPPVRHAQHWACATPHHATSERSSPAIMSRERQNRTSARDVKVLRRRARSCARCGVVVGARAPTQCTLPPGAPACGGARRV